MLTACHLSGTRASGLRLGGKAGPNQQSCLGHACTVSARVECSPLIIQSYAPDSGRISSRKHAEHPAGENQTRARMQGKKGSPALQRLRLSIWQHSVASYRYRSRTTFEAMGQRFLYPSFLAASLARGKP